MPAGHLLPVGETVEDFVSTALEFLGVPYLLGGRTSCPPEEGAIRRDNARIRIWDPEAPGFKNVILRPEPVASVDWVKCSYQSPYGEIVSDWKLENGLFTWGVTVPPNTTATVYVPGKDITERGSPAKEAQGITFFGTEKDKAVFQIASGNYRFASKYYRKSS